MRKVITILSIFFLLVNITIAQLNIDNFGASNSGIIFDNNVSKSTLDAGITNIAIPEFLYLEDYDVKFVVTNFGADEITSIKANYKVNGLLMFTEDFYNLNLLSGNFNELTFSLPMSVSLPETHQITVEILKVNGVQDDVADNNIMSVSAEVAYYKSNHIPMIEVFTSSTCMYCGPANIELDNMLSNYDGDYSIVKYQMNYPPDPYYITECGIRNNFYDFVGIPKGFLDGKQMASPASINHGSLNNAAEKATPLEISGSYYINGNNVLIEYDISSHVNLNDIIVHTAINEKKTTGNVGNNGETEFHHVLMKMIPDGHGYTANLNAGESKHFSYTQNMTYTNVEEMDDLEVVVFVQNTNTKEIYNSKFLYNTNNKVSPVENLSISDNGNNSGTITWDKPSYSNPLSYNIYINDNVFNTADLSYTFNESQSFNVCAIEAMYDNNMHSVKISSFIELDILGLNNNTINNINIYPNPAKDKVYINSADIKKVSVYNTIGQRVKEYFNCSELNVSDMSNGIYILTIMNDRRDVKSFKLLISK